MNAANVVASTAVNMQMAPAGTSVERRRTFGGTMLEALADINEPRMRSDGRSAAGAKEHRRCALILFVCCAADAVICSVYDTVMRVINASRTNVPVCTPERSQAAAGN